MSEFLGFLLFMLLFMGFGLTLWGLVWSTLFTPDERRRLREMHDRERRP